VTDVTSVCCKRLRKWVFPLVLVLILFIGYTPLGCNGPPGDGDGDDETTWYRDADGDRYSDGGTRESETQPQNYYPAGELIALSGDCDDDDPTVHPGAAEINCDGIDQNCDGVDDCIPVWYKDQDGDGYSDGTSLIAETRPSDYFPESDLISYRYTTVIYA